MNFVHKGFTRGWEPSAPGAWKPVAKRARSSGPVYRSRKSRASSVKAVRKVVTKVLKAKLERKSAVIFGDAVTGDVWQPSITTSIIVIPPIASGAGRADRVGGRIQPTGLRVTVTLSSVPANGALIGGPLVARLLVAQQRDQLNANTAALDYRTLMDVGTTNDYFTGEPKSGLAPVNTDGWEVFADELVHLFKTSVVSTPITSFMPTDTASRTFVFNIKFPKTLSYGADGDIYPQNFNPQLMVGYYDPLLTLGTQPAASIISQMSSVLTYTDA